MNQDKECHNCEFKITGLGCIVTGKRVTDHQTCDDWKARNKSLFAEDREAIEQYRLAGYELRIDVIAS